MPSQVRIEVEDALGMAGPVRSASLARDNLEVMSNLNGDLRVFDSAADVQRWNGGKLLTSDQRRTLDSGGVLTFLSHDVISIRNGTLKVTLPARQIEVLPEWGTQGGGLMLARTVRDRAWNTDNETLTYSGLSTSQVSRAAGIASALGIDPAYVVYPHREDVSTLADRYQVALLVLAVLCGLLVAAFTGAQARTRRPHMAAHGKYVDTRSTDSLVCRGFGNPGCSHRHSHHPVGGTCHHAYHGCRVHFRTRQL